MKYFRLFYFFAVAVLFVRCTQKNEYTEVLDQAEIFVYAQPDSVLMLIDSVIINPYLLPKEDYHRYVLLSVLARDKAAKDIHLDTLIYETRDFFVIKKDMRRTALASLYAGRVLMSNQKYEEAFQSFNQAKEYASHFEDNNLKGLIYSSIGFLFTKQFLRKESIPYFKSALAYYAEDNDEENIITCNTILANSYLVEEVNDSAFYYYNQAKELAFNSQDDKVQLRINHNMGLAYLKINDLDKAEALFNQNLQKLTGDVEIARTYQCLSDIYYLKKDFDLARICILKAIARLGDKEMDLMLTISVFFKSAIIEKALGNYKAALLSYEKYNSAFISYYDENKNTALLDLESRYKNEQLRSENKILVLSKQRNLLVASFISIVVLSLLFYLVKRYLRNKKQLSIERQKRIETERKIRETEVKIKQLQEMSLNFTEKENSFRNIVLHQFNILKKSADLDRYVKNNNVQELRLVKIFHKIVYKQEDLNWDLLYNTMNELHDRFFDKLKNKYPTLNDQEFKICCLTYADFTSSEIGLILDLKLNTVQMKRSQIRKKLGMEPQENFKSFFDRCLI